METRKVTEIVFREDLYPRITGDRDTVEKYTENIEVLPPIEINQHSELIDGWHRWTAHKAALADTIPVKITQTKSDAHLLELAIDRNSKHGLQLSPEDKKKMAITLYLSVLPKERAGKKAELVKVLSVSRATLYAWLEDIDAETEKEQKKKAFDLWLSCRTQQEIADEMETDQATISRWIKDEFMQISRIGKMHKNAENRSAFNDGIDSEGESHWKPPLYNVWTAKKLSNSVKHFGNSEQRFVENLLYLYTNPLDIVIDPFAGGGSTIDVCKKRFRRYLTSDRLPIEHRPEIRAHDITAGPIRADWQNVRLVYLDPPYWKQAEGQYSQDAEDLANMHLDEFNKHLISIIRAYASKMQKGYIALIIQPTQWKSENKQFTDHVGDMLRAIKLPVDMRISAPYSTEQYNAQQVEWAKENRKVLVISREIIVWAVGK